MTQTLSKKEAAVHLGVSVRSVEKFIQDGLLPKYTQGRRVLLMADDVEELRVEREEATVPLLNRKVIADLRRRVRVLEHRVSIVLSIHEISEPPLALTDEDALRVFTMAVHAVEHPTIEACTRWAALLPRINEDVLAQMQRVAKRLNPGATFLKLSLSLQRHLKENEHFATSLEMQKLHAQLSNLHPFLRTVVVAFIDMQEGLSIQDRVNLIGGPESSIEEDIVSQICKSSR